MQPLPHNGPLLMSAGVAFKPLLPLIFLEDRAVKDASFL